MSNPTSPPPTCATASAACAGACRTEIDEPIIAKVEADAQPILYLSLTGSRQSPLELTDFADRFITDRVQNVTGVAEVRILGERRYAMRIWLDRARLAAYDITVQEIEAALRAQNVEIPSGRIESSRPRIHGALADQPDHAGAVRRDRRQGRRTASRSGCATWRGSSSARARSATPPFSTARPRSPSASSSRPRPTRSTSPPASARRCPGSSTTCPTA